MNPFEIRIELKSPILIKRWLRLDGLLWHCLYAHHGDQRTAAERLGDYLRLDPAGFYHASTLSYGVKDRVSASGYPEPVINNVIGVERATIGTMRSGLDLAPDKFKPNGRGGKAYKKIQVLGGPYKNRLDSHQCLHSSHVLFHGVGDGPAIAELIDFYIPALGANANIGFGTIGSVRSLAVHHDYSCIDDRGRPTRPIPIERFRELSGANARQAEAILIPPFRNQPSVLCAVPERVRKQKI